MGALDSTVVRLCSGYESSMITPVLVFVAAILSVSYLVKSRLRGKRTTPLSHSLETKQPNSCNVKAESITPLVSFVLDETAPEPIRPFVSKPIYNLTMAIQACNLEDMILMDRNYVQRLRLRERILHDNGDDVVAASEHKGVKEAVNELYHSLVRDYLPIRYPTVFELCTADGSQTIARLTTHLKIIPDAARLVPLSPCISPIETLKTLATLLDDDFILLFPTSSPTDPSTMTYAAQAFVFCCPAGFSPSKSVFCKPLAAIHTPVPGYAAKLEKSMDRFFTKLEAGRIVKRANWSVATDDTLYKPHGNHAYSVEEEARAAARDAENVDTERCHLRVERQTLRRLPQSGAIVFSLKTYLTPLRQVREEGNGEELATAIEGMKAGNVPEMSRYKRCGVWGPKACEFLRSG